MLWFCCGVVTVGGIAASPEINKDAGVHPHSQAGCSRIHTWSWSCSGNLHRHDQHLNHRLPQRRVGGPASSSPAVGLHCMLWQQVNQLSHVRHASTRTDLHTSSFPSPYNISGLLPFPSAHKLRSGSDHLTEFRAYL